MVNYLPTAVRPSGERVFYGLPVLRTAASDWGVKAGRKTSFRRDRLVVFCFGCAKRFETLVDVLHVELYLSE